MFTFQPTTRIIHFVEVNKTNHKVRKTYLEFCPLESPATTTIHLTHMGYIMDCRICPQWFARNYTSIMYSTIVALI
jgi:hypothetical protein